MEIAQILKNIFGAYPATTSGLNYKHFTLSQHLGEVKKWLTEQQTNFDGANGDESQEIIGKIGPATVIFDKQDDYPNANLSKDKLTVQSQSAFLTIKANCCVFKGKWMYEVQLRSKGVMQIGWCSSECEFTQDTGVGDTAHSYGLDGSKQRLWHVQTRKYGPYWRSGDIYGVCLNMDTGTMEYYRNGVALGQAFTDIDRGPGIALFPAFSLAFNDSITANFGGSPFRHPIDGYAPLQAVPEVSLQKSEFLLQYLVNLARVISTYKPRKSLLNSTKEQSGNSISPITVHMLLAGILIRDLSSVITNSYVIEDKAFKFIRGMCVLRSDTAHNSVIYPGLPESTLGTLLSLLWTHLESKQMKLFISKIVNYLSSMYRETPIDLEYEKQRMVIVILTCLCNHPATRKYILEHKFFKRNCLPVFLYIKPPDESTLGELLPDDKIWTEGLGGPRDEYMAACDKLVQCTDILYALQKRLIETLLQNNDGDQTTASSRKIFAHRLRDYVRENSLEHRTFYFLQGTYTTPTQPAVALSFLCILLDAIQSLFQLETPHLKPYVDAEFFYNGSLKYTSMDRLGGALSYLKKAFKQELTARIGEEHPFHMAAAAAPSANQIVYQSPAIGPTRPSDLTIFFHVDSAMFLITGFPSQVSSASVLPNSESNTSSTMEISAGGHHRATSPVPAGNADPYLCLNELLDCCIMYYYAVAHKYIVMIADLRDNIGLLSDILCETRTAYHDVQTTIESLRSSDSLFSSATQNEILLELHERFGERKNVFAQRSIELARKQAWYRSLALGFRRRKILAWMLGTVFQTLKDSSADGELFRFVPEVYVNTIPILLDTVLDFSFHDLKEQYDLKDSADIVQSAAEFLSAHLADNRIIIAACIDSMLQGLGTLCCHQAGIQALETCPRESQLLLINALLRPYENRPWGQSNWLLSRLWLGNGFANRDARPPSIWQNGETNVKPHGLKRSRGKDGTHTGLLHYIAPACPSPYFHDLIAQILIENEPFSTAFINSMLSQLNWAFSEFVLFVQEIYNNFQHPTVSTVQPRQLKVCSMSFELTVSLLRALEMILTIAPDIFKDSARPNSDLLLGRACQLIGQILARVTVPPGCFQHVVDMCLPDLSAVTHFGFITPALGVLLALLKDELNDEENMTHVPRISRILLTDPSFYIASLEFTLGEIKTPIHQQNTPRGNFDPKTRQHIDPMTNEVRVPTVRDAVQTPIITFNLKNYSSHVSPDELDKVRNLIRVLLRRQSIMSEITLPSDDSICPICYSRAVSAVFQPCNHQSCSNCIVQHLMNNRTCFYCKTLIRKVVNFDNAIIYENSEISNTPSISPA